MRNFPTKPKTALTLAALAVAALNAACSRGELSAAERQKSDQAAQGTESPVGAREAAVSADSGALLDLSTPETQTKAPASIEDILKTSPLRNAKSDCATPASGTVKADEIGAQCLTDPLGKK